MEVTTTKVRNSGIIRLQEVVDSPDGNLYVAESSTHVPFEVRRVYFINRLGNPTAVRGRHAHRALQQAIFAINGSFTLGLDDGENTQEFLLDNPSLGILLGPLLWHTMTSFSPDCVILVLASAPYDEGDYIRSYSDFRGIVTRGR